MSADQSPLDLLQRSALIASGEAARPIDGCYACVQTLWISFFFDGFGHDKDEDLAGGCSSNIARLFSAHRVGQKGDGLYRYYYEGMGKRLRDEDVSLSSVASTAAAKAESQAADILKKKAQEAGKSVGTGELGKQADLPIGKSPDDVAKDLKDPSKYKKALGKAVVKIVAEAAPPIRDSKASAAFLGTGFDARIDKALADFEKAVADQRMPIRQISIAVFGFDRGAAVARAFTKKLLDSKCEKVDGKSHYKKSPVHIRFVGLFDCVAGAYGDTYFLQAFAMVPVGLGTLAAKIVGGLQTLWSLSKKSLRKDSNLDIPSEVERVVHFIAAHDLRFFKRVDTVRGTGAAYEERIFPGSQCDVGGGADPADGPNDLAKVPLRAMLREARRQGVPLMSLEQLGSNAPRVAREFDFVTTVPRPGHLVPWNAAMMVEAYQRAIPQAPAVYLQPILPILAPKGIHSATQNPAGDSKGVVPVLEAALVAHARLLVSWMRRLHAIAPTEATNRLAFEVDTVRKRRDLADVVQKELIAAWDKPLPIEPEVALMFGHFVHDPMMSLWNGATGEDHTYLSPRAIDDESAMDRFLERGREGTKAIEERDRQRREARDRELEMLLGKSLVKPGVRTP